MASCGHHPVFELFGVGIGLNVVVVTIPREVSPPPSEASPPPLPDVACWPERFQEDYPEKILAALRRVREEIRGLQAADLSVDIGGWIDMTTRGFEAGDLVPESQCDGSPVRLFARDDFVEVGLRIYGMDNEFCYDLAFHDQILRHVTSTEFRSAFSGQLLKLNQEATKREQRCVWSEQINELDGLVTWRTVLIDARMRAAYLDIGQWMSQDIGNKIAHPHEQKTFRSDGSDLTDDYNNKYIIEKIPLRGNIDIDVMVKQGSDAARINCHGTTFLGARYWLENLESIFDYFGITEQSPSNLAAGDIVLYGNLSQWVHSGIVVKPELNEQDTLVFNDLGAGEPSC
jgi:hypothetical protein